MTDKEKAIIMAYTGVCMLTGDKLSIFYKYIEDLIGRPVMTHEFVHLVDTIKEKSKADFIKLCENESDLTYCEWYKEHVNPINLTRTFTFSDGTKKIVKL